MGYTIRINFNGVFTNLLNTLGAVFVILKLCNVIDWSWFWVLSPFFVGIIIGIITIIIMVKVWKYKIMI